MVSIQEQDSRPHVHRALKLPSDAVIEPSEQELVGGHRRSRATNRGGGDIVTLSWVRHGERPPAPGEPRPIMGHATWVVNQQGLPRPRHGLAGKECDIRPRMTRIEAVPNVSEGRRASVIRALATSVDGHRDVSLLDVSSDATHNRTVLTLVGSAAGLHTALLSLYAVALETIDLRTHTGEHPRVGAVDVVPLVPLTTSDMGLCVRTATTLAAEVAARHDLPVYLYEAAARVPERGRLEWIRRGHFEGLGPRMREEAWRPDFGPLQPHPSAGATVIGARRVLVAFNINLATSDLDVAREVARAIRASNGGLPAVKAIGVRTDDDDVVQVSTNLVDYQTTALHTVFAAVKAEAQRRNVTVLGSEIVGLPPAAALLPAAACQLQLTDLTMDQVLDYRIRQ